jgi:hypothetical protein
MTAASSMRAMILTAPPQARQMPMSMSPKAPTLGEHPFQALRQGNARSGFMCEASAWRNHRLQRFLSFACSDPITAAGRKYSFGERFTPWRAQITGFGRPMYVTSSGRKEVSTSHDVIWRGSRWGMSIGTRDWYSLY